VRRLLALALIATGCSSYGDAPPPKPDAGAPIVTDGGALPIVDGGGDAAPADAGSGAGPVNVQTLKIDASVNPLSGVLNPAPRPGNTLVIVVATKGDTPSAVHLGAVGSASLVGVSTAHIDISLWAAPVPTPFDKIVIEFSNAQTGAVALVSEWSGIAPSQIKAVTATGQTGDVTTGSLPLDASRSFQLFAVAGTNSPVAPPTNAFTTVQADSITNAAVTLATKVSNGSKPGTSWPQPVDDAWDSILVPFAIK
jgi:hypothetical protein